MATPVFINNPQVLRIPAGSVRTSQPTQGTHFSDGVRVGQQFSPSFNNGNPGVLTSPSVVYDIVPATSNQNGFVTTFDGGPAGGQLLPIVAGGGVTQVTLNSGIAYKLDVPRAIRYRNFGSTLVHTLTVYGLDVWGVPMTETMTVPNFGATLIGNKAFYYVFAMRISGPTGGPIGVGISGKIGLPYYTSSANYLAINWANIPVTPVGNSSATVFFGGGGEAAIYPGVFTAGNPGVATANSSDTRGTIDLESTLLTSVPTFNGTSRLTVGMYVPGATNTDTANGAGWTMEGLYGVPQFSLPVPTS